VQTAEEAKESKGHGLLVDRKLDNKQEHRAASKQAAAATAILMETTKEVKTES